MSALFFIFGAVKTNWLYRFFRYLKKFYFRNDKRVAAYLVCVVIATAFWFLNALSKTYTAEIVAPVVYSRLPGNKTLANQLPDKFELTVRAHGFTILRNKLLLFFMPLDFNVEEMTNGRMNSSKKSSFAFPSKSFLNELSYQMSNDLEIINMNPDTLLFKFDKMGQRKVKVKPNLRINLKKQYQISGNVKATPDSVLVSGPQETIDTMHFAPVQTRSLNEIDKTLTTEATLARSKSVFFEPEKINLEIPVDEYTETEQTVPVQVVNQPEDVTIKLFPAKVRVSFQIGLSRFAEVHADDFKLTVSYDDIRQGKQHLKITAESTPAFIYELKITPDEVEYLIEN